MMSTCHVAQRGSACVAALLLLYSPGCSHVRRPPTPCGDHRQGRTQPDDQTPEEAFRILGQNPGTKGTGVFLVPAPEEGVLLQTVRFVPNLTYAECVRRGAECGAFKFIPDELVGRADCPECNPGGCGYACPQTSCPVNCICWRGSCTGTLAPSFLLHPKDGTIQR